MRPGFRVWPVAPHSPSQNKTENSWGRVHGHAFCNTLCSRTGVDGWSLMLVGSEFQHNHVPAARASDVGAHDVTRSFALTGRSCDLSTILGYVGQGCWTNDYSGKANAQRPCAQAGLYICPAEECSGQLFFDLRSYTLHVVQTVSFPSSPAMVMGLLADSGLYAPHGTLTAPPADAHTARLRRLLAPEDDLDSAVVVTDRLTGLPLSVVHLVPLEAEDGSIIMLPRDLVPSPAYVAPEPCPAWLDDGDARADAAARALATPVSGPSLAAGAPPPSTAAGLSSSKTGPAFTGLGNGMAPAAAKALADLILAPGASSTPIWVNQDALRRGDSAPRYAACLGATTIGAYVAMHRAYTTAQGISGKPPRADLLWALERGDIRPVDAPTAIVRRVRAGTPVDHATDLLARRCDHLMAQTGLSEIADLD
jgi:hypothetical protein